MARQPTLGVFAMIQSPTVFGTLLDIKVLGETQTVHLSPTAHKWVFALEPVAVD